MAAAATAGLCCCYSCFRSPHPRTFESMAARLALTQRGGAAAAFTAAIASAGLPKPLVGRGGTWSANSASSASSRSLGFAEDHRRGALSNAGTVETRRTYSSREGDGGRPNRTVAEVQQQQQGRGPLPRPPVIQWEKDFADNAVKLIGRVGRDIEIKYLDSGRAFATTSLAVQKGSQRTEDPSWFTLEIWDDLAESAAHHVAKGELIFVEGKIVTEKRVKDDFTIVKVVVRDLCFVDDRYTDRRQPYGRAAGSQGTRGYGNNGAQRETQSPQTSAGASKWRWEAPKTVEQNRNPPRKVGGIESRPQNNDSLKVEPKRVGDIEANLTRSMTANDVLETQEPEQ